MQSPTITLNCLTQTTQRSETASQRHPLGEEGEKGR
jgi:hypothetical protein